MMQFRELVRGLRRATCRAHSLVVLAALFLLALGTPAGASAAAGTPAGSPAAGAAANPAAAAAGAALVAAPVNTSPPRIAGKPQEGHTLKAEVGVWSGGPEFAYQWLRCAKSGARCSEIRSATKQTYKLGGEDVGHKLDVRLIASNHGGKVTVQPPPSAVVEKGEETARWIYIGTLAVLFAVIGLFFSGLLVGLDKRSSTSKTTAIGWTYLLAGTILSFVISKWAGDSRGLDNLMHSGLAGQYGLLIGGPLGAAIAAKGIVGRQLGQDSAAKSTSTQRATAAQLVQNDAQEPDLGDFQYILFNLVAMVYFVGTVGESPTLGLPHIPDVLIGLTSVSAVGYVAKKALPSAAATAKLSAITGKTGDSVTITGTNLLIAEEPKETPLIVLFGETELPVANNDKERAAASDSLKVTITNALPEGQAVQVFVITPAPARVHAGSFTRVP